MALLFVFMWDSGIENSSEMLQDKSEYIDRMLIAFDEAEGRNLPGYVFLSFAEDITKEEAVSILNKYELKLEERQLCSEVLDPGQPPRKVGCKVVDSWHDGIKGARIQVPVGEEKKYAKMLVEKESKVMFAEPEYTNSGNI